MQASVFLARTHLHIQRHPQGAQENGVIGMTGTPRLVRIISPLRPFLMAVNGFDSHIQIRNPRLFQRGAYVRRNASVCRAAISVPS